MQCLFAAVVFATSASATACPYCSSVGLTLVEQLGDKQAVVLVSWGGGTKPNPKVEGDQGDTTYVVEEILKTPKSGIKKGDKITLVIYRPAEKGDLFLVMGEEKLSVTWEMPIEFTETAWGYLKNAPSPEVRPKEKRLQYYLKFLEFPDEVIANDAYGEFGMAPYEAVRALKPKMNRERLRKWLADPATPMGRHGLYGLMLGICGNDADAKFLKGLIDNPTEKQRWAVDGIIHGYLLLTGQQGLEYIEDKMLKPKWKTGPDGKPLLDPEGDKIRFPFSVKYGALAAMRNQWVFGNDKLTKARLRKSLRLTYQYNPDLGSMVIPDFARWGDWEMMPKIAKDFFTSDDPTVKRACIRYMFAAASADAEPKDAKRVAKAKAHLEAMRKEDKDLVERVERYTRRRRSD